MTELSYRPRCVYCLEPTNQYIMQRKFDMPLGYHAMASKSYAEHKPVTLPFCLKCGENSYWAALHPPIPFYDLNLGRYHTTKLPAGSDGTKPTGSGGPR